MKLTFTKLWVFSIQGALFMLMAAMLTACYGSNQRVIGNSATTMPTKWINSNLKTVVNSSDSVTLTWAPGANVAYYRVYRSINTTFDTYYNTIADALSVLTYDDDKLVPGTTYYYLVVSINKDDSTTVIGRATVTTPTTDKPVPFSLSR